MEKMTFYTTIFYQDPRSQRLHCRVVGGVSGYIGNRECNSGSYFRAIGIIADIPLNGPGKSKASKKIKHELTSKGMSHLEIIALDQLVIDDKQDLLTIN